MRGGTHVGFANGWLNIELDALWRLPAEPRPPSGRPRDIEKKMGLGLVYEAYIGRYAGRPPLS